MKSFVKIEEIEKTELEVTKGGIGCTCHFDPFNCPIHPRTMGIWFPVDPR